MTKYDTSVLMDAETSHALIVRLVGHGQDVLDVGCNTGYVARELVTRGNRVSGVEMDPEAAAAAKEFADPVVIGDLESVDLVAAFGEDSFDVLVFGDVLEHLRDPADALHRALPLLRPDGHVVVSIPNVAHGSVRLALLGGDWTYRELGLLDNTHVSFFNRQRLEELFRDAGLVVVDRQRTTAAPRETEVTIDAERIPAGVMEWVESDDDAWTYQFVWRAVRIGSTAAVARRVAELETELAQATAALAAAAEAGPHVAVADYEQLEEQLAVQCADLDEARLQLAEVSSELSRSSALSAHLAAELATVKAELNALFATRPVRYARRARTVMASVTARFALPRAPR